MAKRWSCLDHDKRIQLEALIRAGHSKKEVAALLGCHLSTVYRELRRGRCKQRDWHWEEYYVYSVAVADDDAKRKRSNCGAPLKLGGNAALADYVERRIMVDRYSPAPCDPDQTSPLQDHRQNLPYPLGGIPALGKL